MVLRKETVEKIADAVMNGINDKKVKSASDVAKIIRVATITEKQKEKLAEDIKAAKERVRELETLKADVGA